MSREQWTFYYLVKLYFLVCYCADYFKCTWQLAEQNGGSNYLAERLEHPICAPLFRDLDRTIICVINALNVNNNFVHLFRMLVGNTDIHFFTFFTFGADILILIRWKCNLEIAKKNFHSRITLQIRGTRKSCLVVYYRKLNSLQKRFLSIFSYLA